MFRLLVDTCVWLDLAKDHRQQSPLGILEELVRQREVALVVPRRSKARVVEESTRILSSVLKRVKDVIDRCGHPDVTRLIQNSVHWMMRGRRPLQVDGDGVVEVFAWETEPGFALHVLNYNNPNLHRGSIRRHYPIGPQKVRWPLPRAVTIRNASVLRAETKLPVRQRDNVVEFTIPRVVDCEVAALEVAG